MRAFENSQLETPLFADHEGLLEKYGADKQQSNLFRWPLKQPGKHPFHPLKGRRARNLEDLLNQSQLGCV